MKQLLFVYNADSGLFSTLSDFAHKILSPATYSCSLCALTYGNFTMKKEWKNFLETLSMDAVFLHRNEFLPMQNANVDLPAVFVKRDDNLELLISKDEIIACTSLHALKHLTLLKIANI